MNENSLRENIRSKGGFLLKAGQGDQPLPGGWRSGEDEESDQIWKRVLLVS